MAAATKHVALVGVLFSVLVLCLFPAEAQLISQCELYDSVIVDRVFKAALRELYQPDRTVENITLFRYYINCLSSAETRNRYKFTTLTVEFNSSIHPGGEMAYFDIGCVEANEWDIGVIVPLQAIIMGQGLPTNDSLRKDCGVCATPPVVPLELLQRGSYDNVTHCYDCGSCPSTGQPRCYGLTDQQCCNFYNNDDCVRDCGRNRIGTSPNFTCGCIGSFLEPDCTVCNFTCFNNGTVNSDCNACSCAPGFTGEDCGQDINECDDLDLCENGGSCLNTIGSFMCTCLPQYTGETCDKDVDECLTSPCQNNGTCNNTFGGFRCNCTEGFLGAQCNVRDFCFPNPCLNGGNCTNGTGAFNCDCLPNYSGATCNTCIIPNCMTCTSQEGICGQCEIGYILRNGQCAINITERCQQQIGDGSDFNLNSCINLGSLNQWNTTIVQYNFNVELSVIEIDPLAPVIERYNASIVGYCQTRENWRREAITRGCALPAVPSQKSAGATLSLMEWRDEVDRWVKDLQHWADCTRRFAPDIPQRTISIDTSGDPDEVYLSVVREWSTLINDFTSVVSPTTCCP